MSTAPRAEAEAPETAPLTTYAELADIITSLPLLIRERRRQQRLSVRTAAAQMGISFSTVSRLENGVGGADAATLAAALRWLDRPEGTP